GERGSSRTPRHPISDLLLNMCGQFSEKTSCADAKIASPKDLSCLRSDAHSRGALADLLPEILLVLARFLGKLLQEALVKQCLRHLSATHAFLRFNALDTLLTRPLSTPRNRATLMRLASATQAWRATRFTRRSSIRPSFFRILSFTSSGLPGLAIVRPSPPLAPLKNFRRSRHAPHLGTCDLSDAVVVDVGQCELNNEEILKKAQHRFHRV